MSMWISTKACIWLDKHYFCFSGFQVLRKIIFLQLLNTCGRCWEFHICRCLPTPSPPRPVRGWWPAESPWPRVSSLVWSLLSDDDALMRGQSTLTGHRMTGCREIFAIGCYPRYWFWPLLWFALVVNIVAGRALALTHGSALSDGRLVPREAGQHWSDHRGQIADTEIETGVSMERYTHLNSRGIWRSQAITWHIFARLNNQLPVISIS